MSITVTDIGPQTQYIIWYPTTAKCAGCYTVLTGCRWIESGIRRPGCVHHCNRAAGARSQFEVCYCFRCGGNDIVIFEFVNISSIFNFIQAADRKQWEYCSPSDAVSGAGAGGANATAHSMVLEVMSCVHAKLESYSNPVIGTSVVPTSAATSNSSKVWNGYGTMYFYCIYCVAE